MESIIAHIDKLELFLTSTSRNACALSASFHDLARLWTSRWGLQWRDLGKTSDEFDRWKCWEIVGSGNLVEISVRGPAYHINETSRDIRTFSEPCWITNPFPDPHQRLEFYHPLLRNLGWIRVTDCMKTDPFSYTDIIFAILRDLADFGAETFPRKLEIALDISNPDLARDLRSSVRLRRSNPLSLVHFLPGLQGKRWIFVGPGTNSGDREYELYRSYIIDNIRQLAIYPRWKNGFYRIELRLARRAIRRYYRSKAFLAAQDPRIVNPTLQILDTIPTILERNLVREVLDVTRLHADHPMTAALGLERFSIRGQRFSLVCSGFSLEEINQYAVRLPMPSMTILTPGSCRDF